MLNKLKAIVLSKKSDKVLLGTAMALGLILFAMPAYAAGEPTLFSNAKKLADAALTWVLILVVPVGALMIGWQAVKKMMSDGDPAQTAASNKAMKNILIAGMIAASASGLAKVVLGFFGVS